jgi:general secretion pathway protein C
MSALLTQLRRLSPVSAGGARPDRLLALASAALTAALAWGSAGLVWSVAAPIGPVGAANIGAAAGAPAADVDTSLLVRFDPFHRAQGEAGAEQSLAQLGLTLFAVRVGGADGGAAVISTTGGGQRSFSIGDSVAPGVTLQAVTPDYAVLARGADTMRLPFPNAPAAMATAPEDGSVGDIRVARTIDPMALIGELALQARMENGEVTGYRLREGSVGPIARRLGLQPGDVLVGVNALRLTDDERLAELQVELTSRPEAVIRYERDGQPRTATVRIAQP